MMKFIKPTGFYTSGKSHPNPSAPPEDYRSDSGDDSENILHKSCVEDASDMSDEDFPVRRIKPFAGKKGVELRKNSWRRIRQEKGKEIPKIYFPWERTEIEGQP